MRYFLRRRKLIADSRWLFSEHENRAALPCTSQYALRTTHYVLDQQSPYQAKYTTPIIYFQRRFPVKVSCLQENLAKGLSVVGRAVANRSTLPVLSNVLLATEGDGRLKLSATNLEVGINCWVGAKIEEAGSITIPARLLTDFVNSLPPERIDMVLNEQTQTLNLRCARVEANIKGIEADDFPPIPGLDAGDEIIHIDPALLRQMINQVTFAAAADESRPILTGIHAQFHQESLKLTGTDGFRLSLKTIPLAHAIDEEFDIVIPARALSELARIISDQEEPVQTVITTNRNQILFHLKDVDLVSQLLEGNFPDVTQIIPKDHSTRTVLDTRNFLKAARVSHLFARDAANIVKVNVNPGDGGLVGGNLMLSATSQELGDNISEIDANVDGDGVEIAFNAKYLIDILNVLDSAQVALETTAPASPGVLRPIGDEDFTHVIMPMHITH
jgi:DNA polymerase-3 subunit beta